MITQSHYPVEPWSVRETALDLDLMAQSSRSSLSNGHIGHARQTRRGEPHGLPGAYLNSFDAVRCPTGAGYGAQPARRS
jgi:alpha,alpha-trehalose phosphorylase